MVQFEPAYQRFSLILEKDVYERLGLVDQYDQPLRIVHRDEQLLRELEVELLDRYSVREVAFLNSQRAARLRNGASLVLIVLLFASTPLQQQLANRWHMGSSQLIAAMTVVLLALYLIVLVVIHRNRTPSDISLARRQDREMRNWILQNCQ